MSIDRGFYSGALLLLGLALWLPSRGEAGGLVNGTVCTGNAECGSGYCYPGPDSKRYCLDAALNCARPGSNGVQFGQSYFYNDKTYSCRSGIGLVTGVTLSCGLSTAKTEQIHRLWNRVSPGFRDSISNDANYPSVIYDKQSQTAAILDMAIHCKDVSLLEELSELYLIAHSHLLARKPDGTKIWCTRASPTPSGTPECASQSTAEVMLFSTQMTYPLARLLNGISSQNNLTFHATLRDYQAKIPAFLVSTFERWLFKEKSMWHWAACSLPSDATAEHAYRLSDYVSLKLGKKLGLAPSAPKYCNQVMEPELWTGAGVTELLSALQSNPNLTGLSPNLRAQFQSYAALVMNLFESRLSVDLSSSPLCGGACNFMQFDLGAFDGDSVHPSSAWATGTSAYDFSHARRWVHFMETAYSHPEITAFKKDPKGVLTLFSNAIVYRLLALATDPAGKPDWSRAYFHNFMDGRAEPYPGGSTPVPDGGFSSAYLDGGFARWQTVNSDLVNLNGFFLQNFTKAYATSDPNSANSRTLIFQSPGALAAGSMDYYALSFLASLSHP